MVLFVLTIASGLYGLVIQNVLPRWMLRNLPRETIYDQIDFVSEQAVEDARTWTVITDASDLIQLQGSGLPWLCLPSPVLPDGVLGNNACADDFFQDVDGKKGPDEGAYKIQEVYDPSLSGFENMLVSSERAFIGDDQIRFGAPTATWP